MKALADYVHAQGPEARHLLVARPARPAPGTRAATSTRSRTPRTWAAWGIDYLKYDWCSATRGLSDPMKCRPAYQKMGEALREDRPPDRLQPVPVRARRRVGVGRRGRRQFVAHHRRHQRHLGHRWPHRLRPAAGPREVRRAGPLERSRHARDRQRRHDRLPNTART